MDITSPTVLKIKGALFAFLGVMSAGLLLLTSFSWESLGLLVISIWAFCRAYYFCFYVMQHYADPSFRYSGLIDLGKHLLKMRKTK
jgi:hypothetical protein